MLSFSVIIPNYNHEPFLKKRIESVLNQSFTDFELIILDDCSTDGSKAIIEKYRQHPKVTTIIYNRSNSGSPFTQWKKGIETARGGWIWIAESDDFAELDFLNEAKKIIHQFPQIGMYYSDSNLVNEKGELIHKASVYKNQLFDTEKWSHSYLSSGIDEINEALKFIATINNASALVFKKEVAEKCLSDLTQYKYIGDWFFYIKACLQTNIYFNNKVLSSYRSHTKNFINKKNPIDKIKYEYYILLIFLLKEASISEKAKLIKFYCLVYLGFGWMEEGFIKGIILYKKYLKQWKKLGLKIIFKTLCYKFLERKFYVNNPPKRIAIAKKIAGFS